MKISSDCTPINLEGCLDEIYRLITQEDINKILENTSSPENENREFGMYIRGEWDLWNTNTLLVRWFKKKYGISQADDISKIILDCIWREVRNQPRRVEQLAEYLIKTYEDNYR